MFHYDGPQPHEQHSPYGAYVEDANPAHVAFGQLFGDGPDGGAAAAGAGAEAVADAGPGAGAAAEADGAAADASSHPPSSYMHEGFLHHVPEWMKKETEQHRDMAHRGGNTAEDRLLAHKRKQEQREREREMQKDAL